jgi:hypothetical protein
MRWKQQNADDSLNMRVLCLWRDGVGAGRSPSLRLWPVKQRPLVATAMIIRLEAVVGL